MIPPLIIQAALEKGIQILGITDHNASSNVEAVMAAAEGTGIKVIPGMEVQTIEDIHTVCLFDDLDQLCCLQAEVDSRLPDQANDPEHFGAQLVVDREGEFLRYEERLLLTSANLSLTELFHLVSRLQGLFIPAHVDRDAFGLLKTLGFVPTDIPIQALEISKNISPREARDRFPQVEGYPLIRSGDAHRLDEIIGVNIFPPEVDNLGDIAIALRANRNDFVEF